LRRRRHSIDRACARRNLHALDEQGEAEAAADAKGGEGEACFAPVHLVEKRRGDADAGAADGVAEGDCATVDVEARGTVGFNELLF
jgi:hypothetical protein